MRVFYIFISVLLTLAGSPCAWVAAAEEGERGIPEIPIAQRIYRERQPETYQEIMEAVESIAESRIAYNAQLKAYLTSKDVSVADKQELTARLWDSYRDERVLRKFLEGCDGDIKRWQTIKDHGEDFKLLSVVGPLWIDREEEKITKRQGRVPDGDVRESIFLTECYLYLKNIYGFKFSMREDVTNSILSPSYFYNLKNYLLRKFKAEGEFIQKVEPILNDELRKKHIFLKGQITFFDGLMTNAVKKYEATSKHVRQMQSKHFLRLPLEERQKLIIEALAPLNGEFVPCYQRLTSFRNVWLRFLSDFQKFGEIFFQQKSLEEQRVLYQEAVPTASEEKPLVRLVTGEKPEISVQEALGGFEEEKESYPQTREEWKKLNGQFSAMKTQNVPQAAAALAVQNTQFDDRTVSEVGLFVSEFAKARAFKYADMNTIFNLLRMAPQPHGHNNLSIKIPKKKGNGFVIRFYDRPHGSNEGLNAFWRWAFKDGFQEAGWIQQ